MPEFQWTRERTDLLVKMFTDGEPYLSIAAALGCNMSQAQDRVYKLKLPSRVWRWTEEQTEELRRLRADGFSYAEIARRMGLRRGQIVGQARYLGLVDPRNPPTPDPKPKPQRVPGPARGYSTIMASGSTFRRDQAGRVALRDTDKAFREPLDVRLT